MNKKRIYVSLLLLGLFISAMLFYISITSDNKLYLLIAVMWLAVAAIQALRLVKNKSE